jgi:hypothetical protein
VGRFRIGPTRLRVYPMGLAVLCVVQCVLELAQHRVARATICRVVVAAGEPIRSAGRRRLPVSSDDIAELRDAGVS